MSYTYLASPYTHPTPSVMRARYQAALRATSILLARHDWTYSPIVHCHTMALQYELPTDYAYWAAYNRAMLEPASTLTILALDGWDTSKGVADEVCIAHALGKPIKFITPDGEEITE